MIASIEDPGGDREDSAAPGGPPAGTGGGSRRPAVRGPPPGELELDQVRTSGASPETARPSRAAPVEVCGARNWRGGERFAVRLTTARPGIPLASALRRHHWPGTAFGRGLCSTYTLWNAIGNALPSDPFDVMIIGSRPINVQGP